MISSIGRFRRLAVAACLVGMLAVSEYGGAGGGGALAARGPRVALLLAEASSPRWIHDYRFFKSKLKQLYPSAFVDVQDAINDPVRQLGQADLELAKGAKVLVVVPVSSSEAAAIVTKAHRTGAKVIAYDQLIQSNRLDFYDSFDRVAVGRAEGRWLASHVARGGTIVFVNGPKHSGNGLLYRDGYYIHVLEPRIRRRYFRNGGDYWTKTWSASEAMHLMTAALLKHHDRVQGVLAASDDIAAGVVGALSLVGDPGKTAITGEGATGDALGRILKGEQSMTVYDPVSEEANTAAAASNAFLRGRPLPARFRHTVRMNGVSVRALLLKPIVITRRNVKTALSDGVVTKKEACRGVPDKLCRGL